MVKLSDRLQTIFDMVRNDAIVADVGSDHGKLMISLYERGVISHGYAIENKKGPYNRLKKALEEANCIENIVPMFSDGITDLPSCVTTLVIAGMGGKTILEILKAHLSKLHNVDTIIVDGHSSLPLLREEISKIGYNIADEKIIKEDGIFYEIIKFIKSEVANYNDKDVEFGPILRQQKSAEFKEKYNQRIKEIDYLLQKDLPREKINQLLNEKTKIQGVL